MESIPPRVWAIVVAALIVALVACRSRSALARRGARRDADMIRVGNNMRYSSSFGAVALAVVISIGMVVRYDWAAWQAWLVGINLVTLVYYAWDKLAAVLTMIRVPETTLHLLAVIGGTIGAIVGRDLFKHKSSKPSFQWVFWAILLAQALFVATLAPFGSTSG